MRIKTLVLSLSLAISGTILSVPSQAEDTAWLMSHLPSNTDSYVRIPPTWEMLGLDDAEQPKAIVSALKEARPAMADLVLEDLPADMHGIVSFFLKKIGGDFEIAIAGEQNAMGGKAPAGYISTTLSPDALETDDIHTVMKSILADDKVSLNIQSSGEYEGVLKDKEETIAFYRFNPDNNHLTLMIDTANEKPDWSWMENNNDELHDKLYQQGGEKGLFVWQKNLPMLSMMLSGKSSAFKALGFSQAKSISLSSQKKDVYDASINLEMPPVGIRQFFPINNESIDFKAGNEIEWAVAYIPFQMQKA